MADRKHLQRLERELVDKGKLIEAGWVGLRLAAIPLDAPACWAGIKRTGKKAAGRLLDGIEHSGFPNLGRSA